MRVAVIDLGTNTFHLIIADLSGIGTDILYKTNLPVKLGEQRINEQIIVPEAFERGLLALEKFGLEISKHHVDVVHAIATSAIRSASNGSDFVKAAKERTGIKIKVIEGDQEALYIFKGVKATGVIKETSLIMDIGGGSTEFIICDQSKLLWKKSYNIGAARLMQSYFRSDPMSENDQAAIVKYLDQELTDLRKTCIQYKPVTLIGSAGAFESFANLLMKELNIQHVISIPLDLTAYKELALQLIRSTHKERMNIDGLIPLRVDMIVIAAILTNYVIDLLDIKSLYLSTYDLKMGVLYTLSEN